MHLRPDMVLVMSIDYMNFVELPRYLCYLLGFIVVMYGAVQSSGVIYLYMHWELLGLFSYLLVFYNGKENILECKANKDMG